jgi:hypothetical protein
MHHPLVHDMKSFVFWLVNHSCTDSESSLNYVIWTILYDDSMAPNLVTSIECQEKLSDSRSVAGNLSQYPIKFGTFSFDEKYCKEYDKLGCDLIDMWRRPVRTGIGIQTHPNC